jgi:hypothetical protein
MSKSVPKYTELQKAVLVASFLFCCSACKNKQQTNEPAVLMNSRWNVDYAKAVCERPANNPCFGDPTGEVKDYESRIATTWAADPTCHGLRLVGFDTRRKEEEDRAIDLQLVFDYVPGDSKQNWRVMKRNPLIVVATGTDDAKTTAHTLCAVLNHKGGSVE